MLGGGLAEVVGRLYLARGSVELPDGECCGDQDEDPERDKDGRSPAGGEVSPQVQHLAMTRTVPHKVLGDVEVVGQPIELSRTPWTIRSATPEPGEHTDAILGELGYSAADIAGLRSGKVV